jgi:hypothetical protein
MMISGVLFRLIVLLKVLILIFLGHLFRRAHAAQVCSNVGFAAVDSNFECSVAKAARQIVSERW